MGMVKSWVSVIVMVMLVFGLTASTRATWTDDFDSYAPGAGIIGQGDWVGWEQVGMDDALVSNTVSNSAPNSLEMGAATMIDLVPQFSGATSGIWTLDVLLYVPGNSVSGNSDIGFLSRHKGFQGAPDTQWFGPFSLNMANGQICGNAAVLIVRDQWIPMQTVFDIDAQTYDIYYNASLAKSGSWGGDKAVVGLDLWAPGGVSTFYYDDFSMIPEPATLALLVVGGLGLVLRRRRA